MLRAPSPSIVLLLSGLCACSAGAEPAATPALAPPAVAAPVPAAPPPTAAPTAAPIATAAPTAAPAPTADPTATPAAAPSIVVTPEPGAKDPPAPPPAPTFQEEAPPPVSADQKAFVTGPLLGTEVVFITVASAADTCASVASKAPPEKGARRAELRVLWKTGYYDFSNRMAQAKMGTYEGTFWLKEDATQGGVQVRAAPTQQGGAGRIHLKAARPGSKQTFDVELDVVVCADVEPKKKASPGGG
jgi:hypothetical protein